MAERQNTLEKVESRNFPIRVGILFRSQFALSSGQHSVPNNAKLCLLNYSSNLYTNTVTPFSLFSPGNGFKTPSHLIPSSLQVPVPNHRHILSSRHSNTLFPKTVKHCLFFAPALCSQTSSQTVLSYVQKKVCPQTTSHSANPIFRNLLPTTVPLSLLFSPGNRPPTPSQIALYYLHHSVPK